MVNPILFPFFAQWLKVVYLCTHQIKRFSYEKYSILWTVTFYPVIGRLQPSSAENAILQQTQVSISPDYNDLVIPCNIAPLNFKINEQAESYITRIYSHKGKEMVLAGQKVKMNEKKWKQCSTKAGETRYT